MNSLLGKKCRDKVTGFEGLVISRTDWLYGCVRYGLQSSELKDDGSVLNTEVFDEAQLELVEKVEEYIPRTTGGARDIPARAKDPTR